MKRLSLLLSFLITLAFSRFLEAYAVSGSVWQLWLLPVDYWINLNGSDDLSGQEFDALRQAFSTWTEISTCSLGFRDQGLTSLMPDTGDGYNTVGWIESGWTSVPTNPDPNWPAMTLVEVNGGWIWECDVYFNGEYFSWATNGDPYKHDVENIAAHEIGHWFELNDLTGPSEVEKTMYYRTSAGETIKRDLHSDDIAGASFLYPYQVYWPELDAITVPLLHFNADVAMAWDPTGKDVYVHLACLEGTNFGPGCYEDTTGQILDLVVTPVWVIYVPNGIDWGQKEMLSGQHVAIDGPHIEIDGEDNVHTIWVERDLNPTYSKVIYRKRDAQTGTWGWTIELRSRNGYISWSTIAVAHAPVELGGSHRDMVYAAWVERDESEDDYNLMFARSTDNGDYWDSPYQIEENDWLALPDMAIDSVEGVHLVWRESPDGDYYDYLAWKRNTFRGTASSWKPKETSKRITLTSAPSIAVDGYGYVHLASCVHDGDNFRIFYDRISRLGGTGSTWDSLGPISPNYARAENPHVVCDNLGFVHLFWDDTRYHDPHSNPRETDVFYSRNFHMGDDWYWEPPKNGRKIDIFPPGSNIPYVYVGDAAQPDTFGDLFVGIDVKWPNFTTNWDVCATLGRQDDRVRELPWPPGQMASATSMSVEEEDSLDIEPQGCYLSATLNRLSYFAPAESQLSCYSVDGRRVHEQKIKGAGHLELDFLPSGTYFTHLKSTDGSSSRIRVVVIH